MKIHDCALRVPICESCNNRPGQLVCQSAQPGNSDAVPKPWVFRYYLCRYCRSAHNRRLVSGLRKLTVIPHIPDEEVLKTLNP